MRTKHTHTHRWIVSILSLFIIVGFTAICHADTPPATPPGTPVVEAPTAPVPQPPAPGQQTPPSPVLPPKKEDEPVAPVPPIPGNGPTPGARPNVFQRASALLQGKDALAAQIAQRDKDLATLRQQLGERDQTINQLNTELSQLRAGQQQLEQALGKIEGEQRTVTSTVAALGFEQAKLPGTATLEQVAENTIEGLQAKLKDTEDPMQRAEIMQRMIELRDAPKK